MALAGIFGRPFVDLEPHLDLAALADVHDEICIALTQVPLEYTGGSHRSMGIVPPSLRKDALVDYGEVIRAMNDDEFRVFASLADDARARAALEAVDASSRRTLEIGEERAIPLSRRQMLWLKVRHRVYFPWKAYVELIPNRYWTDKADGEGKDFTRQARAFFPKTIAFAKSLPFERIGRCNVMGLEANDHGTVHRDGEPDEQTAPDHFITVCPGAESAPKRLFLWDEAAREKTHVRARARAYWFNDHDYHGVDAAPFFRYSVRIDGVFRADFLERLARECATAPRNEHA